MADSLVSSSLSEFLFKLLNHIFEFLWQITHSLFTDILWYTKKRFCYTTCYTTNCIRVTTYTDGISNSVLKICSFKRTGYSLRYTTLTSNSEIVFRQQIAKGRTQSLFLFVSESLRQFCLSSQDKCKEP